VNLKPNQFQISRISWAYQQWRHKFYFRQSSDNFPDRSVIMKDKKVILTFQYLRNASSNSLETSEYVYFVLNENIRLK